MKSSIVPPVLLKLYLDNVVHIADYAFASNTFDRLQVLTLLQMDISTLGPNTLIGLTALRELRLDNVRLFHLPDFLHGVADQLTSLDITGALSIDNLGLISGVNLPALTDIRLRLNARNAVGPTVFQAAVLLSIVDMQNCRIEYIDSQVFYPFRKTLMYINLVGNRLTTVSTAMFDYLLPSIHLKVYLFDNPWNCECELAGLKYIIERHPDNFPGPIICINPEKMMGRPIRSTTFCVSSTVEQPEVESEGITCSNLSATVMVRVVGRSRASVHRRVDGNVSFVINSKFESNTTQITISEPDYPKIRVITNECICKDSSLKRFIPLTQLSPNKVYLLSLQQSQQSNPKLLSYFHPIANTTKAAWLVNSKKSTFIVGLVVAMLILMTLSFLIGTIIFRKAPEEDTNACPSNGQFQHIDVSHT